MDNPFCMRAHLQRLQLLQPLLHKLLYFPLIGLPLMFVEAISRPPLSVFAEIVVCELAALT